MLRMGLVRRRLERSRMSIQLVVLERTELGPQKKC